MKGGELKAWETTLTTPKSSKSVLEMRFEQGLDEHESSARFFPATKMNRLYRDSVKDESDKSRVAAIEKAI